MTNPGVIGREVIAMACETVTEASPLPKQQSLEAMNGETLRRTVTVRDPLGLHMRPLTLFAQRAAQFQSTVTVTKDQQRVNGKSPLELMLLAAQQGTELILEVCGADAQSAIDILAQLLAAPGGEEPSESPPPKQG